MRRTFAFVVVGLLVCVVVGPGKRFSPPRTAVVDISLVFDGLLKKKDKEAELEVKSEAAMKELEAKRRELIALQNEAELVPAGPQRAELITRTQKGKIDLKALQNKKFSEMNKEKLDIMRAMREEIDAEIKVFAEANDLDMVVQVAVTTSEAGTPEFQWPIVHYYRPEFDVTQQLIDRLNDAYRRQR